MAADIVGVVVSVAFEIYGIVETVKANKKRCRRLKERIESLVNPIETVGKSTDNEAYRTALQNLCQCLESAKEFITDFRSIGFITKIWERGDIKSNFDNINVRLDRLVPALSLGLDAAARNTIEKVFDEIKYRKENYEDEMNDWKQFQELIAEIPKELESLREEVDSGFQESHADHQLIRDQLTIIIKELQEIKVAEKRGSIVVQPSCDLKYIVSDELDFQREIGKGDFSTVYEAVYKRTSDTVTVKKYTPMSGIHEKLKADLKQEAEKLKKLEAVNVVRHFGICTEPGNYLLILEYMPWTLRDVLDNYEEYDLNWKLQVRMAFEGASGLYRICNAKPPMLHRCVSSMKFRVNEDLHVKISDVGFSKTKTSAARHSSEKTSLAYIAPEHLGNINCVYNERSEVYSFGIVMWEIVTFQKPYAGMKETEIYDYVVQQKKAEALPSSCPSELSTLIDKCRNRDSLFRPLFDDIVDDLQRYHSSLRRKKVKMTEV